MEGERTGDVNWNPYENMPLELMMLVEVRTGALAEYRSLGEDRRREVEELAAMAKGRVEKERLIDAVERGYFS